jgi:hypothetical protein
LWTGLIWLRINEWQTLTLTKLKVPHKLGSFLGSAATVEFQEKPQGVCLLVRMAWVTHVAHMGRVKCLKHVYTEISSEGTD